MLALRMRTSRSLKPGEDATPLLQFLLAGGGPRIDEHIAHAELFDEAERFLARSGADGEHADHRAHAEHDAQRG